MDFPGTFTHDILDHSLDDHPGVAQLQRATERSGQLVSYVCQSHIGDPLGGDGFCLHQNLSLGRVDDRITTRSSLAEFRALVLSADTGPALGHDLDRRTQNNPLSNLRFKDAITDSLPGRQVSLGIEYLGVSADLVVWDEFKSQFDRHVFSVGDIEPVFSDLDIEGDEFQVLAVSL